MEILSPAGNLEKIKYAVAFGADAVYAGSQDFSLRASAETFDYDDLFSATEYVHARGKKLYVPLNIYPLNRHIPDIKPYISNLIKAKVDAVIVSDIGIFDLVQTLAPELPIHISTQANVTSYQAVNTWKKLGARRIILARELCHSEIKEIRERCPDIELEIFVHGAMCVSYSGRCLISSYLNNRSANLGQCTQPCRWRYSLAEETRPGEFFPVEQDKHGFYFMNSKDLCLWHKLKDIYEIGVDSIKIEGRMKSLYYISAVTRAYTQTVLSIKNGTPIDTFWSQELDRVSHRVYTEGFFSELDHNTMQNYESSQYTRDWQFVGNIVSHHTRFALVKSYHKITRDDQIEIICPDRELDMQIKNPALFDEKMQPISFTKPNTNFFVEIGETALPFGILRVCRTAQDTFDTKS
jgi:putative protease